MVLGSESICESLTESIRDIYSMKCLRYEELSLVKLDLLCDKNFSPRTFREHVLSDIKEKINEIRALCDKARAELGEDMSQIDRWREFERLYTLTKNVNEILQRAVERIDLLSKRLVYTQIALIILSAVLLLITVFPNTIFVSITIWYIMFLFIPTLHTRREPALSFLLLAMILSTGFLILYYLEAEQLILISYSSIILVTLILSIDVRREINRLMERSGKR
ncbi:MAG: hypothetical protein ABWJ42_02810 [Sulfolobales archaeon]